MLQSRIHAVTDKSTALKAADLLESIFDEQGLPISSFENPEAPETWIISVYVESDTQTEVFTAIRSICQNNDIELNFQIEELPDIDWVAATLRELSAVQAGRYVIHGSHEPNAAKPNEIGIQIDAGLAFGTGHHGTTAGCLEMLDRVLKHHKVTNALDLGTGSGVLAIAVAKSLPIRVLASDIDPVSTLTASENARINHSHQQVECITATGFNHRRMHALGPFDLIIANILARPLQSMAPDIAKHAQRGGIIILSGLLPHQRAAILATFRIQGLIHTHSHYRDGWMTLVLKKP